MPPSLFARFGVSLAMVAVVVVALALRWPGLDAECLDCDELYAVRIQGVTPKAVALVMARDGLHTNHPPLMTVPFLFWNAAVGTSEAAVRALPLLAGLVAIVAVFAFGRVFSRPWAGVFAALLLAINPLHITYSTEARQYALVTALLAVAHLLFVLSLRCGSRGVLLAYYLVAAWAALTHYFAVPVLLGHAAAAAWLARRPGALRVPALRLFLAVGLAGLPYFAWLPIMRYQSQVKWDHLAPLTPASFAGSLTDLLGVGGWGSAVGFTLTLVLLGLMAYGVWSARGARVAVASPTSRLVPAWLGWVVLGLGVLAGIGFAVAFPRAIEPAAREALASSGYGDDVVNEQLALLRTTGFLGAGCVVLAGAVVLAWRRWETTRASGGGEPILHIEPRTVGLHPPLAFFLLVPVAVLALGALTGVPFHRTRNLIVLLPAVCIAWGFGLDRLCRTVPGVVAAVALLAGLGFAAAQYPDVTRNPASPGPLLGTYTIDWREVKAALPANPPSDRAVVLVDRPATDPALYYLAEFRPLRVSVVDSLPNLPSRVAFVHLTGNTFSERTRDSLQTVRGPLVKVAAGHGWEVYTSP